MKVRIIGSGTSTGVPQIGCACPVCTSADPKDNRLRASAIVETDDARILIDCGPDFRTQVLRLPFEKIDGVLITHEHYDHGVGWTICVRFAGLVQCLFMRKIMWHKACACVCPIVLLTIVIREFPTFLCRKSRWDRLFQLTTRRCFLYV